MTSTFSHFDVIVSQMHFKKICGHHWQEVASSGKLLFEGPPQHRSLILCRSFAKDRLSMANSYALLA